jgi:hypothetical protein
MERNDTEYNSRCVGCGVYIIDKDSAIVTEACCILSVAVGAIQELVRRISSATHKDARKAAFIEDSGGLVDSHWHGTFTGGR